MPLLLPDDPPPYGRAPWPTGALLLFTALAALYVYLAFHAMRGQEALGLAGAALRNAALVVLAALFAAGFLVGRLLRRRARRQA